MNIPQLGGSQTTKIGDIFVGKGAALKMRLKLACAAEYGVFARCRFQTPFYKKEITGLSLDGHEEDLRIRWFYVRAVFGTGKMRWKDGWMR